jgi:hypothetical protein
MKKTVSLSLLLTLLLNLVWTPLAQASPAAGPYMPDPVNAARQILEANPAFEQHLDAYRFAAADYTYLLNAMPQAASALQVIDELKAYQAPFQGSGWGVLVSAMDSAVPGSGQAAVNLDETLRAARDLQTLLNPLTTLRPVVDASLAFRSMPDLPHLSALQAAISAGMPTLKAAYNGAGGLSLKLYQTLTTYSLLKQGLAAASVTVPDPVVRDSASRLQKKVAGMEAGLGSLYNYVNGLASQMQVDLKVMQDLLNVGGVPPAPPAPVPTLPPAPAPLPPVPPAPLPTITPWAACPYTYLSRLSVGSWAAVTLYPNLPNRVRSQANTSSIVLGFIQPGEVVWVLAGPKCSGGWVWWNIRASSGLQGWTSEGDAQHYWLEPR